MMSSGYIYLIHAVGTENYKIGKTSQNPKKRLADLQTGNHCKLRLLEYMAVNDMDAVESNMHQEYKRNRLDGEWFSFADIAPVVEHFKTGLSPRNRHEGPDFQDVVWAIEGLGRSVDELRDSIETQLKDIASSLDEIARSQRKDSPVVFVTLDGREMDAFRFSCYADGFSSKAFAGWIDDGNDNKSIKEWW